MMVTLSTVYLLYVFSLPRSGDVDYSPLTFIIYLFILLAYPFGVKVLVAGPR